MILVVLDANLNTMFAYDFLVCFVTHGWKAFLPSLQIS